MFLSVAAALLILPGAVVSREPLSSRALRACDMIISCGYNKTGDDHGCGGGIGEKAFKYVIVTFGGR